MNELTITTAAMPLIITVRPARLGSRGQAYDAFLEGQCATSARQHVTTSRTPFYAAARKLIEQGHSPDTILIMRHEGVDMDCLKQRLGAAAKLTVREDAKRGPCVEPYKPFKGQG